MFSEKAVKFISVLFFWGALISQSTAVDLSSAEQRYKKLLIFKAQDYQKNPLLNDVYASLLPQFKQAVTDTKQHDYGNENQLVYFDFKMHADTQANAEKRKQHKDNRAFQKLFSESIPLLAYAYLTPEPKNKNYGYYNNPDIAKLYIKALEYTYSRGLDEQAWLVDHSGSVSAKLQKSGFVRTSGDLSAVSLHLGGYIQSIFLMQQVLQQNNLLERYKSVVRNLVVNHGVMYSAFAEHSRAYVKQGLKDKYQDTPDYFLNADGIRLFVDYFIPYILLVNNGVEQKQMLAVLTKVIGTNIAIKSGTQDTIKPDGVGYHHHNAYVGAYSPFAIEVDAQLLYLFQGSIDLPKSSVNAVKLAITSFRQMAQKYNVSNGLSGRLINSNGYSAAIAINKSMAMLAHPEGFNDQAMQGQLKEYFDKSFFFASDNLEQFFAGKRGVSIRGLGIFELINRALSTNTKTAKTPNGAFIKPYANAAFFRDEQWLATAKGFSQYLWDYEGPVNKRQNSFGQNWSNGLLEIYNAGTPVSAMASGFDIDNGFDWYHLPGTTASHYPIKKFTKKSLAKVRKKNKLGSKELHRSYNDKTFVGGVSLGKDGLFVQDLAAVAFDKPTNLTAYKSYFFVDGKILALGSDISGGTLSDETHTTLFQTKLLTSEQRITIAGEQYKMPVVNKVLEAKPQGLQDSVGNSYYLAKISNPVTFSINKQQSLTAKFKPSQGLYSSAIINHGIKPQEQSYEYVVLPNDINGEKLTKLASNASAYYQVLSNNGVHAVDFPTSGVQAYGFYQLVDTPKVMLVKASNKHAAIITKQTGNVLALAASVPDFGWPLNGESVDLAYAGKYFSKANSQNHALEITLRGKWRLEKHNGASAVIEGEATVVTLYCKDGLTENITLVKY